MHPWLADQLIRHFGSSEIQKVAADSKWVGFLEEICETYEDDEAQRQTIASQLSERNDLLANELKERLETERLLQKEKAEQTALIKKLEEAHNQLLQSEKMASIGQLAAGVAHEINNPIGFVSSNLTSLRDYVNDVLKVISAFEVAMEDPSKKPNVQKVIQEVDLDFLREDLMTLMSECQDGIQRVRQIVQDLKDFSHVDHGEWVVTDLHKGLESTLNIVNNEIKYKATVEKHFGKIPEIPCIGSQLNQVFMNLLVNAAHAIPDKGIITLSTGSEGGWVWVEVADNGVGISQDNLKRIFDPFFTTKPVGKGTGLGLSLAYGIVQKHNGRIEVTTEIGKGTKFTVWLPVEQKHADSPVQADAGRANVSLA
jgi:signal transduction histidine kinase